MNAAPKNKTVAKIQHNVALEMLYECIKQGLTSLYINVPSDKALKAHKLEAWHEGAIDALMKIYAFPWYLGQFNDLRMKGPLRYLAQDNYDAIINPVPKEVVWLIKRYRYLKYYGDLPALMDLEPFIWQQKEKFIRYLPRPYLEYNFEGYYMHLINLLLNDERDINERIDDVIDDLPELGLRRNFYEPISGLSEQEFDIYSDRTKNIARNIENYFQRKIGIMTSSLAGFRAAPQLSKSLTSEQRELLSKIPVDAPKIPYLNFYGIPYDICTEPAQVVVGRFHPSVAESRIHNYIIEMNKWIDELLDLVDRQLRSYELKQEEECCTYSKKNKLADAISRRVSTIESLLKWGKIIPENDQAKIHISLGDLKNRYIRSLPGNVFEYRKNNLEAKAKWMQQRIDATEGKGGYYIEGKEPQPRRNKNDILEEYINKIPWFKISRETPLFVSIFDQTLIVIDSLDKELLSLMSRSFYELPRYYYDWLENESIFGLKTESLSFLDAQKPGTEGFRLAPINKIKDIKPRVKKETTKALKAKKIKKSTVKPQHNSQAEARFVIYDIDYNKISIDGGEYDISQSIIMRKIIICLHQQHVQHKNEPIRAKDILKEAGVARKKATVLEFFKNPNYPNKAHPAKKLIKRHQKGFYQYNEEYPYKILY